MKVLVGLIYFVSVFNCIQGYEYKYIGCFQDNYYGTSALTAGKIHYYNSPKYCADRCASVGYRYFGLQTEYQCWCGNSGYDRYGVSDNCQLPCLGSPSHICGGINANSVYEIVYSNTTETSPSTSQRTENTNYFTRPVTPTSKEKIPLALNGESTSSFFEETKTSRALNISVIIGAVTSCTIIVLVVLLVSRYCLTGTLTRRSSHVEDARINGPEVPPRPIEGIESQINNCTGPPYQTELAANNEPDYIDVIPDTERLLASPDLPERGNIEATNKYYQSAQPIGAYALGWPSASYSSDESTPSSLNRQN